jgi:hypothetical protein
MRVCVVCGTSLEGRRADARHCGGPCRAEASLLRAILRGKTTAPYGLSRRTVLSRSASQLVVSAEGESQGELRGPQQIGRGIPRGVQPPYFSR